MNTVFTTIGKVMVYVFLIGSFFALPVGAQTACKEGEYCALTTIPGLTTAKQSVNPVQVVTNIYGVSIGIAAILAVAMIVWAGVEYATVESLGGKSDAKDRWHGALIGLVLLLSSYIILKTINVDLVNINLDLGTPIKGDVMAGNLQSALDSYDSVLKEKNKNEAAVATLTNERNARQARLTALEAAGNGNSAEANALRTNVSLAEADLASATQKLEASKTAFDSVIRTVNESTATYCYTPASRSIPTYGGTGQSRITDPDICFRSQTECATAQSKAPGSGACKTLSSVEAARANKYCVSYQKTTVAYYQSSIPTISKSSLKNCFDSSLQCASGRTSLMNSNGAKKPNETGYIDSVGDCTAELKTP